MLIPFDDNALLDEERQTNILTQHAVEGISLLKEITHRLNTEGASQELAIMIESIDPDALPERYPRESFTQDPTPTNLNVAAESAIQAALKAIQKASKAVVDFIVELYRRIMDAISRLFDNVAKAIKGQAGTQKQEAKNNDLGASMDGDAIKDYNPEDGSYALNDKVVLDDGDYTLTLHYDIIKDALSPLVVNVFKQNLTPGMLQQNIMAAFKDARMTTSRYEEFADLVDKFNKAPNEDTFQALTGWMRNEEEREHYYELEPIAALVDAKDNLYDDVANLAGHGIGPIITLINQHAKERYDGDAAKDPIFKRMVRSRYDLSQFDSIKEFEKQITSLNKRVNGVKKTSFKLMEDGWSADVRDRVQTSVNVYLEYFKNRSRLNTQIMTACALIINDLVRFSQAQQKFEAKLYGELLTVKERYELDA